MATLYSRNDRHLLPVDHIEVYDSAAVPMCHLSENCWTVSLPHSANVHSRGYVSSLRRQKHMLLKCLPLIWRPSARSALLLDRNHVVYMTQSISSLLNI